MSNTLKVGREKAAILFTDISGFTKIMSNDEEYAYRLMDKKRQLFLPLIDQIDGTLVKQIGDGTLSIYNHPSNAIHCAKNFQQSAKHIVDLNVRVGIHYGEVIKEEDDVFGDVVNIAKRLETLAKSGSVIVSREALDHIEGSHNLKFVPLGLQALKGVGRLIEVFALNDPGINVPSIKDYQGTSIHVHTDDEVPSIAVIPFENKGAEEDVFYSYGISSDLISDISSAGVIRIASMKNIENIKNYNELKLEECARKLFVRYIATGTLWRMGNLFQLSIELYDTKESCVIWSDRWQEQWENLTAIKGKLTDGLLKSLASEQKVNLKPETLSSEAYEFYLKGKYKYEKRQNKEDQEVAHQLLKKALALDEKLISARITLGNNYNESGQYKKAFELYEQARIYAEELNDQHGIGSALNNIGNIHLLQGDYDKAEKMYEQSLRIRKNISDKLGIASSMNNLGNLYRRKGEYKLAFDYYEDSLLIVEELEDKPGIATALNNMGVMQRLNNNYDDSLNSYKKAFSLREELEDKNGMALLLNNIGNVYFMQDDLKQALIHYHRSLDVVRKTGNKMVIANSLNNEANIYFSMADYETALNIYTESLDIRKNLSDKHGIASSFINIGIIYSILGKHNKALACFTQSRDIREGLNDKNGLINALKNIGKISLRMMKYDIALINLQKAYELQKTIDKPNAQLAETKIRILLANKKISPNSNKINVNKYVSELSTIDYELNFDIYLLTGEIAYFKNAYNFLKTQAEQLNPQLKKIFITYPLIKYILEEYQHISE